MLSVLLVFLVGAGFTGWGVVWSSAYDIGVLMIFISLIGLCVRLGQWLLWLRK